MQYLFLFLTGALSLEIQNVFEARQTYSCAIFDTKEECIGTVNCAWCILIPFCAEDYNCSIVPPECPWGVFVSNNCNEDENGKSSWFPIFFSVVVDLFFSLVLLVILIRKGKEFNFFGKIIACFISLILITSVILIQIFFYDQITIITPILSMITIFIFFLMIFLMIRQRKEDYININ